MKESILVEVVNKSVNLLPTYSSDGAFAMDIRSNMAILIQPRETVIIKTGLHMAVTSGYAMRIVGRSGLSSKGIIVSNAPGTIDEDYRGEVGVILTNTSNYNYHVEVGDRVAQCYLEKKIDFTFVAVDNLSETVRGEGGFGSTGK